MSWIRALLSRRRKVTTVTFPDASACSSLEEYAYRLCLAGTPTPEAESLLRAARSRQEAQELHRPAEDPERPAERLAARQESASAAASWLLTRVGEEPDEDVRAPSLDSIRRRLYQGDI
jgi:hypothetical protein